MRYFKIYEVVVFPSLCGILNLKNHGTFIFNKMTFYPKTLYNLNSPGENVIFEVLICSFHTEDN